MDDPENVPLETPTEPVADPVDPQDEPDAGGEPTPEQTPEQLIEANKKLFARAKKAEDALKAAKANTKPAPTGTAPQPSVEETVLLANGMPKQLVTKLKSIAKVEGYTSLLEAQADPIFVAVKEKFEKDKKIADASLPSSRGAGGAKAPKAINTPGLTREEHRKMVLDQRG